ncbi:hypothetical protein B0H17DRAFT_1139936 [Mycena rosella]|uniref:Uncharacterized protein n=1 Tax=Mycena rosella TaxID=1033263 RepID=A0AAD7D312_MYCRO|nr:hypothetical protein B0H17DRAFT_1139936 [Mycena rosella]
MQPDESATPDSPGRRTRTNPSAALPMQNSPHAPSPQCAEKGDYRTRGYHPAVASPFTSHRTPQTPHARPAHAALRLLRAPSGTRVPLSIHTARLRGPLPARALRTPLLRKPCEMRIALVFVRLRLRVSPTPCRHLGFGSACDLRIVPHLRPTYARPADAQAGAGGRGEDDTHGTATAQTCEAGEGRLGVGCVRERRILRAYARSADAAGGRDESGAGDDTRLTGARWNDADVRRRGRAKFEVHIVPCLHPINRRAQAGGRDEGDPHLHRNLQLFLHPSRNRGRADVPTAQRPPPAAPTRRSPLLHGHAGEEESEGRGRRGEHGVCVLYTTASAIQRPSPIRIMDMWRDGFANHEGNRRVPARVNLFSSEPPSPTRPVTQALHREHGASEHNTPMTWIITSTESYRARAVLHAYTALFPAPPRLPFYASTTFLGPISIFLLHPYSPYPGRPTHLSVYQPRTPFCDNAATNGGGELRMSWVERLGLGRTQKTYATIRGGFLDQWLHSDGGAVGSRTSKLVRRWAGTGGGHVKGVLVPLLGAVLFVRMSYIEDFKVAKRAE